MRIALGSDHAGFVLKELLGHYMTDEGHEIVDLGTHDESAVDYPDYGAAVGRSVASGEAEFGVCVCGTGIGIGIAANKIHGIRAAVVDDVSSARLARAHNNANVICFGARLIGHVVAADSLDVFLQTVFEGDRHIRRIEKITALEESC